MRVFFVSPANFATGGTELLHQLSYCLTQRGIENYMIYTGGDGIQCPVPVAFLKYNVKYVTRYIDTKDAVLVLAETQVHLIHECVKGTAMIWWLSVDNYFSSYQSQVTQDNPDPFGLKKRDNVIHFAQSYYAKDFLKNFMRIEDTHFLMDYINDEIIDIATLYKERYERKNICLYNPKKGYDTLKPIIDACRKDIEWVPLQGLKPCEMAKLMCKAKLYVDFGAHPGKDRIPREAAVCGCCIMTNQKGSAAYQEDVPIPEEYKINDTQQVDKVLTKIYELMDNYDNKTELYDTYREKILGEKAVFLQDLQLAISLLEPCVEKRCGGQPQVGAERYRHVNASLHNAIEKLDNLASAAVDACDEDDKAQLIDRLYTMDFLLQMIREAVYAELIDMRE